MMILVILMSACTKKEETSTISIAIPDFSAAASSKPISQSVTTQDYGDQDDWGQPAPSSISEFNCFGIFIGADEPELSKHMCADKNNNPLFRFGMVKGLVRGGQSASISVDLKPGPRRSIYLIGFSSADNSCETITMENSEINESNYSPPFLLGSVTKDIVIGPNSATIRASYDPNKELDECDFGNMGDSGTGFSVGTGADGDPVFAVATPTDLTELEYLVPPTNKTRKFTAIRRVSNISISAPDTYDVTLFSSATTEQYDIGDEVMLYIAAASGGPPNGCGEEVYPGFRIHGKVVTFTGGDTSLQVKFNDSRVALIPNSNLAATASVANPFCRAVLVRVPNFKNLTFDISSSGKLTMPEFGTLTGGNHLGGILSFRVKETLSSIGNFGSISVSGTGYARNQAGYSGEGTLGFYPAASTASSGSGGGGSPSNDDYPGGGGHGGTGGPGYHSTNGSYTNGGSTEDDPYCGENAPADVRCLFGKMFMGGAGGTYYGGSTTGSGGGLIAIFANKIDVPSAKLLKLEANAGASDLSNGGSAGGSILVRTRQVNIQGQMFLSASGGNSTQAGGGGGGRLHVDITDSCTTMSVSSITLSANGGGSSIAGHAGDHGTKLVSGPAISQLTCNLPSP